MAYAWTVYATMTAVVLAVVGLLGTALFSLLSRLDRLGDRMDARFDRVDEQFDRVDERFDRVDQRMRTDKDELLGRLDVLAERVTRLEAS